MRFKGKARNRANEAAATPETGEIVRALPHNAFRANSADERLGAEQDWERARRELELRVWQQTEQWIRSHQTLQVEIAERKKAETALRELSGRLLRLQDEERRRIARELHDSTSQVLVAVSMNLDYLLADASANERTRRQLQDCASLVEQCATEIRTISYLLHPPALDVSGLEAALGWAATGFSRRSGIAVKVDVPQELGRFSPDVELAMFRIVQEALTNIHRHSGSRTARIAVRCDAAALTVCVEDQGHGFPEELRESDATSVACLGVGVAGMRERIRQLGGVLEIISSDAGTRITARVPLPENGGAAELGRGDSP